MFENFEITVSIGDANKAALALRCCGLTHTEVEEVIQTETAVAIQDYGIVPKNSIAPDIIDSFGTQFIKEAIAILYYYMDELDFEWEELKFVLNTLLTVYRPEDIIKNPDYIKLFTNRVFCEIENLYGPEEIYNPLLFANLIEQLTSDKIKSFCRDLSINSNEDTD